MHLQDKHIALGITGSIAAYKSALLVRLLKKAGAQVQVVMSPSALDFITPLTLATLADRPVKSDFTEDGDAGTWSNHVDVGLWADAFVVAPCSANTLAKMATGVCDNFLLACYLSAKCPVFVAPAMDRDMFLHGTTADNLETLLGFGNRIVEPGDGELASGLHGKGRMAEPEDILHVLQDHFAGEQPLAGRKALVTAGPTYERLDPVRFLGNYSSGKMGYALAAALTAKGAQVHLVSGPTALEPPEGLAQFTRVESAAEMLEACEAAFAQADITVMAAAVADYRPAQVAKEKIKKKDNTLSLQLEKTTDILAHLGTLKQPGQFLVGFALETENEVAHAKGKLERKNLDLIVLNSLRDPGAGFATDTNKVSVISKDNKLRSFELKSKADVAMDIVALITEITNT